MIESIKTNKQIYYKFNASIEREGFIKFAIIINPLIDMLFNIFKGLNLFIPINQVIRIGIFIVTLFYLRQYQSFKKIILLTFWLLFVVFVQYCCKFTFSLFSDIAFIVKIISAYAMYRLIYEVLLNKPSFLNKILKACLISSLIIMLNIFLAVVGVGNRTYSGSTDRMSGYIGFLSGNCITANCLMILFVFNILYCGKKKIFFIILNFIALMLLATKFSVIGTFLIIITFAIYEIYASPKRVRGQRLILFLVVGICFALLAIPLLVDYIEKLFKYGDKFGWNFFDMLTSNRGMQIEIIEKYYVNRIENNYSIFGPIFGYSYSHINFVLNTVKVDFEAIEWDFHGIYYYLGSLTLIILIFLLLITLKKGLYFIKNKNRFLSYFTIILFVILCSALLGGHVFYESVTLQYLVIIIATINSTYKLNIKRKIRRLI